MFLHYFLSKQAAASFSILVGFILLLLSLSKLFQIKKEVSSIKPGYIWNFFIFIVFSFCLSYIFFAYNDIKSAISFQTLLDSCVYLLGALFVYLVLNNIALTVKMLINRIEVTNKYAKDAELLNDKEKEQNKAVVEANKRMKLLYKEVEQLTKFLENKESELRKQNTEFAKVNFELSESNLKLTEAYDQLKKAKSKIELKELQLKEKNKYLSKSNLLMAQTFKKFIPESFLPKVISDKSKEIHIGYIENLKLSIVLSDVRSFTSIAEILDSRDLFNILNRYFSYMADQVYKNNGFVDMFIGDAIISLFEDNKMDQKISHVTSAVLSAIGMQRSLNEFNQENKYLLKKPIQIGIGVHTGEVMIGTTGYATRLDISILGETLDIVSTLESLTKEYGVKIIVSEKIIKELDPLLFQYRQIGFLSTTDPNPLKIYELFDCDENDIFVQKQKTKPFFKKAFEFIENKQYNEANEQLKLSLQIFPEDNTAKLLSNKYLFK